MPQTLIAAVAGARDPTQTGVGPRIGGAGKLQDELDVSSLPRSVDLVHPAVEKVTLVLEGIGGGKIRVNSSSLDHPFVILADQGLENAGIEKKVMMGRVGRRPTGSTTIRPGTVKAGYGPATK